MMSLGLACAVAGMISLGIAAHPFVTYPVSLRAFRRRPIAAGAGGATPQSVAVCVSAFNEEAVIAARVENLLAARQHHPDLRILIYDDGSTDGTAAILARFGSDIDAVRGPGRMGKTHGMNLLVARTGADIVVFSDANVRFAPDAITELLAPFADPAVGCVCGHLQYETATGDTAEIGARYWRLEETIKQRESETGSIMGADGSIFAIRRALHTPPPPDLIDDMFVSLSILAAGYRIVRAPAAHAYEAAVGSSHEEFRRKIRIACQAFNVHRVLWPRLRRLPPGDLYKYVSHKLLRWLAIFWLLGGLAALLLAALLLAGPDAAALLLALALLALALLASVRRGPLARLREILLALTATGIGVIQSIRGRRFQVWTPPVSARVASRSEIGTA